ncbi:MAG TPA: hypothetical protein VLF89_07105 [Candidatus Saccharimonadales bacterium]|nr:hypothetical protein [Candidatus Saccharimonadales bacterium]
MYFLDKFLPKETKELRKRLIEHELWKKIANGTLEKKRLGIFTLQDYWLVNQAPRIDSLTIASLQNKELQNLLIARLTKNTTYESLIDFGIGVGLTKKDFENIVPIAGCMALTTFFYWMIDYSSDIEKIAAIMTSVSIFSDICMKIYKPLMKYYNLTEKQVEFFSIHETNEGDVAEITNFIESHFQTKEERKMIAKAIHVSHKFELMFYDTILFTSI